MGDGGVACAPSQHVMEKFTICGGKTNGNTKLKTSKKSTIKIVKVKRKMKPKKDKLNELESKTLGTVNKDVSESNSNCDASNGNNTEEVEEGELGTMPLENGEFVPEKPARRYEIKSEVFEVVPGKWRKCSVSEKGDWRTSKDELEKGEFVPDTRCRTDAGNRTDEYGLSKTRRYDAARDRGWRRDREFTSPTANERGWKGDHEWSPPAGKDKGWKGDHECELTPPSSGKCSSEKELGRSVGSSQHARKLSSRYEVEKTQRTGSKIVGEERCLKNDLTNDKSHGREYSFSNRSKRHLNDSDNADRKYHAEYDEYSSSKNRRLSDDSSRSSFSSDHQSGRTIERLYKNVAAPSSRSVPSEKYSSRYVESSKGGHERLNSSPRHSERSPQDRVANHDHRDRSPPRRDTPYDQGTQYDRTRHHDKRYKSPTYLERSPRGGRNRDGREHTPTFSERSPRERGRYSDHRETSRKAGASDKRPSHGSKGQERKHNIMKDPFVRESEIVAKESEKGNVDIRHAMDKSAGQLCQQELLSDNFAFKNVEFSQTNGEEASSMEVDMEICNTPPHAPVFADTAAGKWFYLDHYGVERGPSKLSDLKTLLKERYLVSDHLVKHLDSERWVSVEKAVSPLITENFVSVVPDTVTQLVSPPEAPGNLSADSGNALSCEEEMAASSSSHLIFSDDKISVSKPLEDFHIDDRVGTLIGDAILAPGKEVEMLADVLKVAFEPGEWERRGEIEVVRQTAELISKDTESGSPIPDSAEKENALTCIGTSESFTGYWVCKGCDWKLNEDASQERTWKRKQVLNDGYPLCQMPKSGCEDPRWEQKDDLYYPSQSKRLDLPLWAFTSPDELNDPSSTGRSTQNKSIVARGVRGVMLPVVRINACVVKDHGSFVSEPRVKIGGKDRLLSRSSRPYSTTGDAKKCSEDGPLKISHEQGFQDKSACFSTGKDSLCKIEELKLQLGNWYYLDGAGYERGPLAFPDLQVMAEQGVIQKQSSVFRKSDNIWVPVTVPSKPSENSVHANNMSISTNISEASAAQLITDQKTSGSLHGLYPQFIGYTRGKLHELVMKSYKRLEFAAAINEVLDPWINARQPKKEIDKYIYNSDHFRTEDEYEMEEDAPTFQKNDYEFDDLCADVTFRKGDELDSDVEWESWDMLDGHVLARVFHFLRGDAKSLFYAALTCKHWRSVVMLYKGISRQVDFSSIAPICSDTALVKIMKDYKKENITSLLLRGCTKTTFGTVEELLQLFPSVSTVDIRGCFQLDDLVCKFPNVNWVRSRGHHLKVRSINHTTNWSSLASNQRDDSSGLKEYLESSDKRDSANQLFRRSLYKRSKLFDARKSSSILSRDAQLRRLAIKKTGSGYRKLEEYIAASLRDIMRENTFEVFGPKVAGIEERMRNGYYASRGLKSIKDDISRMCRDAIKIKNQGDARDMNRIVTLFLRLVSNLDKRTKSLNARDDTASFKDESPPGFSSSFSKYKKKTSKVSERKYRSNGTLFNSGDFDSGDFAFDREIRRRLSKLNKKSLDTGSDTSDDFDRSSDASRLQSESSASETESDIESISEGFPGESRGETYFTSDNGFDSMGDEREWGARMTKAGLVPPVTRKYEVIDHYAIVADEEEVRRKMQVSLPEDYDEKLIAQKNGTEESDMEIPEVKNYKPRKLLGDEVIEQEVYGIDPYTHNLLLDSMPEESGWSLADKHSFIEEVLLRTLNRQVRDFTGSANTPMMYPLRPVLEEILETAEKIIDRRTMRVCQFIMKAIDSRLDDNYVAYRKGLGVVCNKEGGFTGEDFVVEFLGEVYPTWKWFEKQDGIRALQKHNNDPAPEFYNIYLERPKGDADGYDLVVVDAMHKANYASRICHSCRPNCEAKVTAVDGQYQIGIYCVRPIAFGEEITFDYNSVTESKEEYEASVCLCGNQVCRGSYLNLTGEGAFEMVLEEHHGLLDRHRLLLEACELNSVCEEDYIELGKAGLGSCLLGGLPDWLVAYSARLVRFINFERTRLPAEILRHNIEEKKRYFAEIHMEVEKSDAEIQAEGVYNQRLQNLALTIDKVRYVMRCIFGNPKNAPPPLERLTPEAAASYLWQGEGSFVEELTHCMAPHMEDSVLSDLKSKIHDHDPCSSDDTEMKLRKSLLWLRDEVRNLPCTYKSRHDAAADSIHIYAHTKYFLRIREYKPVTSPPVYITPLDLGPKYADKLGSGVHEYCKTYGETYCLGQLIFWYNQNADPDAILAKASRGCLSLPNMGSFYAQVQKPSRQRVYGPRTLKFMLARMEKQPQRAWPKDRIWTFKNSPRVVGSPMLDAILDNSSTDREMLHWLKHRPSIYQATWDR